MSLAEAETGPPASGDRSDRTTAERVVTVSRAAAMRWAVGTTALLSLVSIALTMVRVFTQHGQLLGFIALFDIEQDGSLPSVLSAALMLGCTAVAWAGAQEAGGALRRHWRFLALAFGILTLDELTGMHLVLDQMLQDLVGAGATVDLIWGGGMGLLVAAAGLAYLPFLRRLPQPTATRFVVAGTVYVAAAVGLDTVSGVVLGPLGSQSLAYALSSLCEEITEMAGLLIFIDAGLRHLGRAGAPVGLHLRFCSP